MYVVFYILQIDVSLGTVLYCIRDVPRRHRWESRHTKTSHEIIKDLSTKTHRLTQYRL